MWSSSFKKYLWTRHAREKMRYYRLSESRIQRVIRHPVRVEEGVLEGAVACMSPSGGSPVGRQPAIPKNYSEIWVMYLIVKMKGKQKIKIITAWRYPGKSPERDPVPAEILREIRNLI